MTTDNLPPKKTGAGLRKIKRILVIGCGGSGKSTFAVQLARATGLKLYHLDSFYWQPGWNHPPAGQWEGTVEKLIREDEWIIDGSYFGTLEMRLKRAEAVILFDLPRMICLWRVFKRRIQNSGGRRLGMPDGCPERIYGSFVKWILRYPEKSRPLVLEKLNRFSGTVEVFTVKRSGETAQLIDLFRTKNAGLEMDLTPTQAQL